MKPIVLTGMPASGKTSTAKILANFLNLEFIDIDSEIENSEGKTISEIFSSKGEEYFRDIEHKIIISKIKQNSVISIGGGAFENESTRHTLLSECIVIYLQTSVDVLFERAQNSSKRPLLIGDKKEKIINLLQKREKNYKLAHFTVMTDNKSVEQVAGEISKCVNLK